MSSAFFYTSFYLEHISGSGSSVFLGVQKLLGDLSPLELIVGSGFH